MMTEIIPDNDFDGLQNPSPCHLSGARDVLGAVLKPENWFYPAGGAGFFYKLSK